MNNAAHAARGTGATALAPALLKAYLARYDAIVDQGLSANPTRATGNATISNARRTTLLPP